jgi:lantibiotic biosynthesis protein
MTHLPDEPTLRGRLTGAAERIGERLVRGALRSEHGCTWQLMRPPLDATGPAAPLPEPANGALYGGTAGIAVFLAELHRAAPDPELERTARGALRFALREGAAMPDTRFGLYNGRVGIAYAAMRAGPLLGLDLRAEAEAVLRPLAGNEQRDGGLDVIAGAAGAIPTLLRLAGQLDPDLAAGMALRLGEHLRELAIRLPDGWSWGAGPVVVRGLCGFSHGSSGMAHAFLELHRHTGDGGYRYAAEQALLYERGLFSPGHGNWPDLRHRELGEAFGAGQVDALARRLRAGDGWTAQTPGYKRFWCHGAPGIGLARLRAYQRLGAPVYLDEARIAINTTIESLSDPLPNYSLCHGLFGNCETLLLGAEVLGDPALREHAVRCALRGIERYEDAGRPWPCGTLDGASDPGLLLGEAGIGLFLLRLADPRIESVLLVAPPDDAPSARPADDDGYQRARVSAVREHFGRTLSRFAALGVGVEALLPPPADGDAPAVSDVAAAYASLRARIDAEADPARRELLEDAFRVDGERYALLASITDYADEFMQSLARRPAEEVDWDAGRFRLTPRTRVVETRFDWQGWRPAGGGGPERRDAARVLHRTQGQVAESPLSPLAAAVLRVLEEPATVGEAAAAIAEALAGAPGPAERQWLRGQVREQLATAYRTGLIEEVRPRADPVHHAGE